MVNLIEYLERYGLGAIPIVRTIFIVLVLIVIFNIVLGFIRRALLKRAVRKRTISNIKIFTRIARYAFLTVVILVAIFSFTGEWTGLGIAAGLTTAALGWALQRPITGVAAWLMLVIRRPFEIGDWIIIAGVRGEVVDISLTHIYLVEVGGVASSEEKSGRVIMVPNSILFEQTIINYTHDNDYTLDEVVVAITYDSDLDKAIKIGVDGAGITLKEFWDKLPEKPYARTYFQPSGINLHIRYFVPTKRRQELSSKITQEIFRGINKEKKVSFAVPHTKVLFKDRKKTAKF